ncbi:hypothetical protein K438DRAFT_1858961 [Mycena galopus ATCC 62051]|nr:hypothetical protein K438DRAFT_1858961 [Mycena galopus ATCC 62051]
MVNLTAMALAGTLFSVTDFQGHVLDEAFGILNDFNPVVGQGKAIPLSPIQQWSFVATNPVGQFALQNANSNSYLSYAGAPSGNMQYAQAVIDQANPRSFNLLLVSPNPEQFNIVDVGTGLALTAWAVASDRGTSVTPVTYEPLQAGAAEQIFTLVAGT